MHVGYKDSEILHCRVKLGRIVWLDR
jgi:hypothetical protein